MNKTCLAIKILEINLDEWEPQILDKTFIIKSRTSGDILGKGKNLTSAIRNAQKFSILQLRGY